ncbi:MAG: hypothetical protein WCH34_12575 [Bacteroidota bacterium]
MKRKIILGIYFDQKTKDTLLVQNILTKFGCSVRTRLGLHDMDEENNDFSLILLELTGDMNECMKLENELLKIEGLKVQKMLF